MNISPIETTTHGTIGERIRKIRREKGLTQEALAEPEFTKGYISALERGAVRPSLKALDVFARRLEVPITFFLAAQQQLEATPDLEALQEELVYQANYAKMLIRAGQVREAHQVIDDIETTAKPYQSSLPVSVTYLVPFLRGRAYLQVLAPDQARPELEAALEIAKTDPEATARVRNLLGVVFFELSQSHLALEQHLLCLQSIRSHAISDLNFRVNVYRNVANDYWALNDPRQAISMYKEVLPLLEDLNDMQQQAMVFWGMAVSYKASQDWPHARIYATRALHIYEASDNRTEAASICLNLAETLLDDQRFEEAGPLLEDAERLLSGTGNKSILSYLHRDYADLARRKGQHEEAMRHARQAVALAQAYYKAPQPVDGQGNDLFWQDPIRVYAEALRMEALIEEDQGKREVADRLFGQALALLQPEGFEETRYALNLTYAKVLQTRGEFEKAVSFYQVAAELHPHAKRRGI
jgi:tetratricopeptide (TPR) repeat protein